MEHLGYCCFAERNRNTFNGPHVSIGKRRDVFFYQNSVRMNWMNPYGKSLKNTSFILGMGVSKERLRPYVIKIQIWRLSKWHKKSIISTNNAFKQNPSCSKHPFFSNIVNKKITQLLIMSTKSFRLRPRSPSTTFHHPVPSWRPQPIFFEDSDQLGKTTQVWLCDGGFLVPRNQPPTQEPTSPRKHSKTRSPKMCFLFFGTSKAVWIHTGRNNNDDDEKSHNHNHCPAAFETTHKKTPPARKQPTLGQDQVWIFGSFSWITGGFLPSTGFAWCR